MTNQDLTLRIARDVFGLDAKYDSVQERVCLHPFDEFFGGNHSTTFDLNDPAIIVQMRRWLLFHPKVKKLHETVSKETQDYYLVLTMQDHTEGPETSGRNEGEALARLCLEVSGND